MINSKIPSSLRLSSAQRKSIATIAKEQNVDSSKLIRKIIDEWLEGYHKKPWSRLDEAKIKAVSEILYIVRGMADKFDTDLKEAAKAHALDVVKKIKEMEHEPSGH